MTGAVIIAVRERLERVRREQGLSLVDRLLVFGPPRGAVGMPAFCGQKSQDRNGQRIVEIDRLL